MALRRPFDRDRRPDRRPSPARPHRGPVGSPTRVCACS